MLTSPGGRAAPGQEEAGTSGGFSSCPAGSPPPANGIPLCVQLLISVSVLQPPSDLCDVPGQPAGLAVLGEATLPGRVLYSCTREGLILEFDNTLCSYDFKS